MVGRRRKTVQEEERRKKEKNIVYMTKRIMFTFFMSESDKKYRANDLLSVSNVD